MMEAVFGLLGVIVGSFIPWIKDSLSKKQSRTEEGAYLAVRVICILEEYLSKCVEVLHDDGTVLGQPAERDENGFGHYIPQVSLPELPIILDDVNWRSIDSKLVYRILSFPNTARSTNESISFVANDIATPPDNDELFEARWEGYANLGLEALSLVDELRKTYKLPESAIYKWNPDWNPRQYLKQKKSEVEERQAKRASAFDVAFSSLSESTDNKKAS